MANEFLRQTTDAVLAAQELVRHPDLEVDAIVHRGDEGVGLIPALGVQLRQGLVAPGDDGLVRRQLLQLPIQPHVLGEASVDPLNVGRPISAVLTADRKAGVHLRQEGLVGAEVVVEIRARDGAGRRHGRIGARGRA